MRILSVVTPMLRRGDDIARIICASMPLEDGDVVAVSSKAMAVVEGAIIDLSHIDVSDDAREWDERLNGTQSNPAFRQAVLNESRRMNGKVISSCPQAMLCELKPEGLRSGRLLAVNAGLDLSNCTEGFAVGWPQDCVESTRRLREELERLTGKRMAVMLTDSCCRPGRIGVTAMALTVAGFNPLMSMVGKTDLFGRPLSMTVEGTADQLATAANFVMGNCDQSTPAAIIRAHGLAMTDHCGWVNGITAEEDLFRGIF